MDRRHFLSSGSAAALAGCSRAKPSTVARYSGPLVTHVEVRKSDRAMYLWSNGEVLKSYAVDLGFAPDGHKQFEGDGRTPEGQYWIDRRNPQSEFYLSLGISYPNARDVAFARKHGLDPGGDIFIHGEGPERLFGPPRREADWTAGCIAVKNDEMVDIYRMIRLGTPITLRA